MLAMLNSLQNEIFTVEKCGFMFMLHLGDKQKIHCFTFFLFSFLIVHVLPERDKLQTKLFCTIP